MASQTMSGKTNYNTDPNHIYYNLQAYNNDTIGSSTNVPVKFEETRTSTILANPSEYFLSIQRFSLDTPSLPVFIPEVETDPAFNPTQDPNILVYQVSFYFNNGVSTAQPITYPIRYRNNFDPTVSPPPVLDVNAISDRYYWVNQFQDFLDMINATMQERYAAAPTTLPPPPYFTVKEGNIFQIYFPSQTNAPPPTASYAPIYSQVTGFGQSGWSFCMNAPLYNLFSSIRANYINSLNNLSLLFARLTSPKQTSGWYQIANRPVQIATNPLGVNVTNVNQLGINNELAVSINDLTWLGRIYDSTYFPTYTISSFEVITAPYSTAPLWNCVKSIIFTTALFPVTNELEGLPIVQNSNQALDTDVQNNNFLPVITDLEVPYVRGDESKPSIQYSPQGEYRLIDLQSNAPINNIEISVFWRDQYGTLHPFVLEPGCFSSLKILFRKKIFNLIYLPEYTRPPF